MAIERIEQTDTRVLIWDSARGPAAHTVRRYARAATWQELVDGRWQTPRASMLDPFKLHLHQRVDDGCGNLAQLLQ